MSVCVSLKCLVEYDDTEIYAIVRPTSPRNKSQSVTAESNIKQTANSFVTWIFNTNNSPVEMMCTPARLKGSTKYLMARIFHLKSEHFHMNESWESC